MKAVLSWFCGLAITSQVCALTGLEAYYRGDYTQAAALLKSKATLTAVEEYDMGRMYLYGYGVLKSNVLAQQSFKRAADKGSIPAQLLLAKMELFQNNHPDQALVWFKKAAKLNDPSAQLYCAGAYLFGVGTSKNADLAREYSIAAARNNQSIAQQVVAADFLKSNQAATKKIGVTWLKKAVDLRDPEAELMMADLYIKGEWVTRSFDQAKQLIEDAVSQEYVPAYYQMGRFEYLQNEIQDAQTWYQKAADLNYLPAQFALAELYLNPENAHRSVYDSFRWMQKAAQSGYANAQHALAVFYKKGVGVPENEGLAAEWERKAQTSENSAPADAQRQLAEWLTRGKIKTLAETEYQLPGIYTDWQDKNSLQDNVYNLSPQLPSLNRQDIYQAQFKMMHPNEISIFQYYDAMMSVQGPRQAQTIVYPEYILAEPSHSDTDNARLKLTQSKLLAQRDGYDYIAEVAHTNPVVDYSFEFKRLLDQAVLGDSTAQFDVAQMYQHGIGVAKSMEEAIKYYQLAAAQNDLPSEYQLGLIYLLGLDVTPNPRLGLDWLMDAAFKGNYYAQYAVARIYENGYQDQQGSVVIPADKDQSLAMYQLAAANHYGLAQYHLADILLHQPPIQMNAADLALRHKQINRLLQGAVESGVEEAKLHLAFYDANNADEAKQAQAFSDIQAAAESGSSEAEFLLGLMYDRGIATQADRSRAIHWYAQSETNPMSAFILGTYLADGNGIKKNLKKANDYLQFAASKHFAAASFNLGVLKKQEDKEFLPDIEKAAALGLSRAGLELADYYTSRESTPAQLSQARVLYEQFAKQGLQSAQIKLGYLYEQGLGVARDYNQALSWYTLAAQHKHDHGRAQFLIGRLYQFGLIGNGPNYAMAKQWYGEVKGNYAPAAVASGFIDETEYDDYRHAFSDYQQASDLRDPSAEYNLALIYEKGKNQAVDTDKAKRLFKQAAQHKIVKAMVALGQINVNEHNITQALSWLSLASSQHDADALYQLGWLSEKGLMPGASITSTIQYYQDAATQGQGYAILALGRLYESGIGVPKNLEKAAGYYERLAQQNYPGAQYQMAKFCLSNMVKSCTHKEAKNWLVKAEQSGYREAAQLLRLLTAQTQTKVSYIETIPVS